MCFINRVCHMDFNIHFQIWDGLSSNTLMIWYDSIHFRCSTHTGFMIWELKSTVFAYQIILYNHFKTYIQPLSIVWVGFKNLLVLGWTINLLLPVTYLLLLRTANVRDGKLPLRRSVWIKAKNKKKRSCGSKNVGSGGNVFAPLYHNGGRAWRHITT